MNIITEKYRVYFNNIDKNKESLSANVYVERTENEPQLSKDQIAKMARRILHKDLESLQDNGYLFETVIYKGSYSEPSETFTSYWNTKKYY